MLKRVLAAVLVNPNGRLWVQRRRGQLDWILPGGVVLPGENDQDSLHLALRKIGVSFDYADHPIGCFEGRGLPHWPEVELVCYQPHRFSVHDELGFGLEQISPADLGSHQMTEVEQLALAALEEGGIWPISPVLAPAVA